MSDVRTAIAARRFGLGPRPGELGRIADPLGWLSSGLEDPARYRLPEAGLPTVRDAAAAITQFNEARRDETRDEGDRKPGAMLADVLLPDVEARYQRALRTDDGFAERLVWFWSNHFTVAATKASCAPFVGAFERDVVRAHLAGTFEEMLLASARHPAMLLYLDQARSAGSGSVVGLRRELGLNENLAREVLELHTLGVDGGYVQQDVIELARALTGFTVMRPQLASRVPAAAPGDFVFVDAMHEPGDRTILGERAPEAGEEQAVGVLRRLARHPSTARHVARKLARHFVADDPPAEAVATLARVFLDSGGSLPAVHRALLELPEAFQPEPRKFLSPNELVVAALRSLDLAPEAKAIGGVLQALGQPPFRASSPAGWPDTAAEWGGPNALMKRVEWAQRLAGATASRARPEAWLDEALGPLAGEATRTAVKRAASVPQGIVLGLMSPEFQRR